MEKRDPIPHGQLGRGRQPTRPSGISRQRAKLASQPFITANRPESHQARDQRLEAHRWPLSSETQTSHIPLKKALTVPALSPFGAGRSLGTSLASSDTHDKFASIIPWLPPRPLELNFSTRQRTATTPTIKHRSSRTGSRSSRQQTRLHLSPWYSLKSWSRYHLLQLWTQRRLNPSFPIQFYRNS